MEIDATDFVKTFFQSHTPNKPLIRRKNTFAEDDQEEGDDDATVFFLKCSSPASTCSSLSMDTLSLTLIDNEEENKYENSWGSEFMVVLGEPLTPGHKNNNLQNGRLTSPRHGSSTEVMDNDDDDDEMFTYVTLDGISTDDEDFIDSHETMPLSRRIETVTGTKSQRCYYLVP